MAFIDDYDKTFDEGGQQNSPLGKYLPQSFGGDLSRTPVGPVAPIPDVFTPRATPSAPQYNYQFDPMSGTTMTTPQYEPVPQGLTRLTAPAPIATPTVQPLSAKADVLKTLDEMDRVPVPQTQLTPGQSTEGLVPVGVAGRSGEAFVTPEAKQKILDEEQRRALGLPEGVTLQEGIAGQKRINEMKAGVGARAIRNSLREQGMSDAEIKEGMGYTPEMSRTDALKALTRLQKQKMGQGTVEGEKPADPNLKRAMDRINNDARRGEDGTPKNRAAKVQDAEKFFNQPATGSEDKETMRDYMTPSQKREYERYAKKAAYGGATSKDDRRMADIQESIQAKVAGEEAEKQAKLAEEAYQQKQKELKRKEDKDAIDLMKTQMTALQGRLDNEDLTKQQKQEIMDQQAQIRQNIIDFQPGQVGTTEGATTHKQANEAAKVRGDSEYMFEGKRYRVQ